MSNEEIIEVYLSETVEAFRSHKKLAERAMEQVSDEEFFKTIDEEANSIATIAKHIGGNLRSRWTDFLTSDGEKADRNRDSEFVTDGDTRASVMQFWEDGFEILLDSLRALTAADLGKIVQIRGEDFTVVKAINRAGMHTASHIGQIQLLAKHFRSSEWKTLSVPRNKSAEFNNWLKEKEDKGNYLEATREFTEKDLR
ncbi:MAG: DUF1572 domain-containing protein [Acidobacteriota bacterium]|nr:DUF1572 domain-containing protein [Acidobacteriota bacterium]